MRSRSTPVLSVLTDMTASSLESSSLSDHELMLARIAAMAAMGATPVSYVLNIGAAADSGITLEDVQGVLSGVAPIIGTSRVIAASANIAEALSFALDLAAELDAAQG